MLGLGLVAGLVALRRRDLGDAAGVLTASSPVPFLLAFALSLAGVLNRAGQYRWAHHVAGVDTTVRAMLRISAVGYALNKVVKTGGVGGVALFVRHGRRQGRAAGSTLAACVVNSLGNQIGLLVLALAAVVTLVTRGSDPATWTLLAGGLFLVMAAGLIAVVITGLRSRAMVDRWYPVPFALAGRAASAIGLPGPSAPDPANVDRFFETVHTLRGDPGSSVPVVAHAIAAKLLGAAVLATALWAVGAGIGPGPVLVVYVLALAAAATTILPGGLGAVEATMTLTLTGYGVEMPVALAATIVFRLLDLWVPVLLGALVAPGLDQSTATPMAGAPAPSTPASTGLSGDPAIIG